MRQIITNQNDIIARQSAEIVQLRIENEEKEYKNLKKESNEI